MKIIYNNILPFKGFLAVNLFGVLFVRKSYQGRITDIIVNHEKIHTAQMKELFYIFFYIIYFFEWIGRLIVQIFTKRNAYKNISFEKEAYANERNLNYLKNRKHFAQWKKKLRYYERI